MSHFFILPFFSYDLKILLIEEVSNKKWKHDIDAVQAHHIAFNVTKTGLFTGLSSLKTLASCIGVPSVLFQKPFNWVIKIKNTMTHGLSAFKARIFCSTPYFYILLPSPCSMLFHVSVMLLAVELNANFPHSIEVVYTLSFWSWLHFSWCKHVFWAHAGCQSLIFARKQPVK